MPSCLRGALHRRLQSVPGARGVHRSPTAPAFSSTPDLGRSSLLDGATRMSDTISNRARPKLDFKSSLQNAFFPVTLFSEDGGSTLHSLLPASLEASRPSLSQIRSARLLSPCCHARLEPTCSRCLPAAAAGVPASASPLPGSSGHSTRGQQVAPGVYRTLGFGLESFPGSPLPNIGPYWDPFPPWGSCCGLRVASAPRSCSPVSVHPRACAPRSHKPAPLPSAAWAGAVCLPRSQSRQAGLQPHSCSAVGQRLRPCASGSH